VSDVELSAKTQEVLDQLLRALTADFNDQGVRVWLRTRLAEHEDWQRRLEVYE
jgi:hypothetical protein